jgi:hypothetical protein
MTDNAYTRTPRDIAGLHMFTRHLPPAPAAHTRLPVSWRILRRYISFGLVAAAIGMLLLVFVGIVMLSQVAELRISPWTVGAGLVDWIRHGHLSANAFMPVGGSGNDGVGSLWLSVLLTALILFVGRFFILRLPYFALSEEQAFRQGAEHWTAGQRVKASVLFGFAHIGNIIYPFATLLALSAGGYIFTRYYLRVLRRTGSQHMAVYKVTALHSVYNLIAVLLLLVVLLSWVWGW